MLETKREQGLRRQNNLLVASEGGPGRACSAACQRADGRPFAAPANPPIKAPNPAPPPIKPAERFPLPFSARSIELVATG